MKEYVLGLIYNLDNTIVVLQLKDKPDWQHGRYNGIGGSVEVGETRMQAMKRESKEEVGIEGEWTPKFVMRVSNDTIVTCFKANFTVEQIDAAETFAKAKTAEPLHLIYVDCLHTLKDAELLTNLRWMVPLLADTKFEGAPLIAMTERS